MKKDRKCRFNDIDLYKAMEEYNDSKEAQEKCQKAYIKLPPYEDTRFYGVFLVGDRENRSIKVDIKRYEKIIWLSDEIKAITNKRKTHYFTPAKRDYYDYNCNMLVDEIYKIRLEWQNEYKPIVEQAIIKVKSAEYQFDDLMGALEPEEVMMYSASQMHQSYAKAETKRQRLDKSLYAQFFHQLAAKIEAATMRVLTKNGFNQKRFNRNILYTFNGCKESDIKNLDGFSSYELMYAIWNFLKHNSISTYETLKKINAKVLPKTPFRQGDLAVAYVLFTDKLIQDTLLGVEEFFKEYCRVVFKEDYKIAQWNYDDYFLNRVNIEIEGTVAPLGIPLFK